MAGIDPLEVFVIICNKHCAQNKMSIGAILTYEDMICVWRNGNGIGLVQ